jgi:hypothetical protein
MPKTIQSRRSTACCAKKVLQKEGFHRPAVNFGAMSPMIGGRGGAVSIRDQ